MEGWFYSKEFNHWQKVNDRVYAYVSPMMWGSHYAQLYIRGTASMCSLEARTENDKDKMFALADEWLVKYSDGDLEKIHQDTYSISNQNGVWSREQYHLKQYWI